MGHIDHILSVCYSSCGKVLTSVSSDKTIKLWDTVTNQEISTLIGHTSWVNSCCLQQEQYEYLLK